MSRVKLDDIARISRGASPRPIASYVGGTVPWIKIGDASAGDGRVISKTAQHISVEGAKRSVAVKPGDLIVSNSGTVGLPFFVDTHGCIHDGWLLLSDLERGVNREYLFYAIKSKRQTLIARARTGTQLNLNTGILGALEIELPALTEQRRIVEILDRAELIQRKRRRLINKLDELLDAQLQAAMVVEDQVGKLDFRLIKDLCLKVTDGTHHSPKQTSDGVPYVTATHIKPWVVDFERAPTFVSQEDHEPIYSRCNPEAGDVLYIKDGVTTGIAAINRWEKPFSMLSSVALLKPDREKIVPEYLCGLLNSELIKKRWTSQMAGGAIRRLTLTKIKTFDVPVLSMASQKRFATLVDKWWHVRTELKRASNQDGQLLLSLQSRLLA